MASALIKRFGDRATFTMADRSTLPVPAMRSWSRRRDRRGGLAIALSELSSVLAGDQDVLSLRVCLEETLSRALGGALVQIADAEPEVRLRGPGPERLCLPIPPVAGLRGAVLEVALPPGVRLDDWGVQLLDAARALCAMVLELERTRGYAPLGALAGLRPRNGGSPLLIGSSPIMAQLRDRIERVAGTDFTVLIEGESGVGKELVARLIHDLSRRRRGPFVAVNCAAIVETLLEAELFGIEERTATGVRGRRGKFEHAEGGTLFLDEVSDLSKSAQAKLLRAIQELSVERVGGQGSRRVDIRVVAATNRGLSQLVEAGSFRADLYYRLNGVEISVPPLRDREDDVAELARHFLERHRPVRGLRISASALDALRTYRWPGNVRELQRVIERAVALASGDEIQLDDLPPAVTGTYADVLVPSLQAGDTMRAWGGRYARLVLERCDRNKRRACRALDISYHTLQGYLEGGADRKHGNAKRAVLQTE